MEASWYHRQQNSGSVTSRHHQCGQEAEVTMAGLLLGVNHTSLCKGSYSNMFSQASDHMAFMAPLVKFKLGLGAGENSQQPQTALPLYPITPFPRPCPRCPSSGSCVQGVAGTF